MERFFDCVAGATPLRMTSFKRYGVAGADAERALREAPLRAGESRSLLAKAMGFLKMNSSKKTHRKYPDLELWQRSFHEHVIRNERDYREIWGYIDSNPAKWAEDRYYEQ